MKLANLINLMFLKRCWINTIFFNTLMFECCVVIFKRLIKSDNPSKTTAALTDQDAELGNSAGRIVTCSIDDEEEQDKEEDEEEVKAPRCRVVGVAQVLSVQ